MTTNGTLTEIPLHLLSAELLRRQTAPDDPTTTRPPCSSGTRLANYNTPLHVFALFLILALSTFACSFPIIVRRFPTLPVPNYTLFLSRHFGTGVLIATAFVHLLPTAYVSLTDPCLPRFWNEVYPPMAGFVAMISVMIVVGIEMFFAAKGAGHSHSFDLDELGGDGPGSEEPAAGGRRSMRRSSGSFRHFRVEPIGILQHRGLDESGGEYSPLQSPSSGYTDTPGSVDKPLPATPREELDRNRDARRANDDNNDDDDDDSHADLDDLEADDNDDTQPLTSKPHNPRNSSLHSNGHVAPSRLKPPSRTVSFADPISTHISPPPTSPLPQHTQEQRLVLQCLLLEAGILFHSIFIGLALSVSTGSAFIVLLIAISFHQTFEGLALGSRIAAIPSFSTESLKPWIMSLMYGITTPVGQAIGLAVHSLYDPESEVGLLMVGIVNAVSAGLLLYAGLVQLLAEDFLSDRSYVELAGRRRVEACAGVVGGALLMSLVGAFA